MLRQPKLKIVDKELSKILLLIGNSPVIQNPEPGIFILGHWNFGHHIENLKDSYPIFKDIGAYGVCDSVEQFKGRCEEEVLKDPRPFCVGLVSVRRNLQPSSGGWRWHKWGEYIGTQNPMMEYLFDEPLIEEVFTYHIYELEQLKLGESAAM